MATYKDDHEYIGHIKLEFMTQKLTCQPGDSHKSSRTGNADQVSVVVGDHSRKEGLVRLSRETDN